MRFHVLGPLEVWHDDQQLAVGGPQQRALLAVLLLYANHVTSSDQLIAYLWAEQPPPTARGLLQGCVAGLRRALRHDEEQRLLTRAPGYLLDVRPGELDLDRFADAERTARQLAARGGRPDLERAATLLTEGLSLWHGPALADVALEACRAEATHLEERRIAAVEDLADVELRLGRNAKLVSELPLHIESYPLRERLWAQLMLALYGADRQAEALEAYRRLRETLIEQAGVEPGATVRQLQHDILAGADALDTYLGARRAKPLDVSSGPERPPLPAGPAQLPAAPSAFTGRARQLKRLDELLSGSRDTVRIAIITGTAGVGKTALAVHWAHQARERFGDGQLYVDLRGYAPAVALSPIEALSGLLQALGLQAKEIPAELDAAAGLYRTLLNDKRVLVVLDNAHSVDQVRPLLPGSPDCLVVVTSRYRLGGLVARDGGRPVVLDALDPDEAATLLGSILGPERVAAEPEATAGLAEVCARLPLALRIAAANLAFRPEQKVADQVAELTGGDRLGGLAVAGDERSAVRAAFDLSYGALDAGTQRLFRLVGLAPGPDVTASSLGTLAGVPAGSASSGLDQLADAHLIGQWAPGRYAFHDLLRLYAAERCLADEPDGVRADALSRLVEAYLHTADTAARLLFPEKLRLPLPERDRAELARFETPADALAWLDAERANLRAIVQHTSEHGPRQTAWLLANTLQGYFHSRMHVLDWLAVGEAALAAAETESNPGGQAAGLLSLGDREERLGNYSTAASHYGEALEHARQAGWLEAQASALGGLAILYRRTGRAQEAAGLYAEALELDRRSRWVPGLASRLVGLGNHYAEQGRLEQAVKYYVQALEAVKQTGSLSGEAVILGNYGECCLVLGRYDEALDHFTRALALNREIGHRGKEADTLRELAAVHCDTGNHREAQELARAAVTLAQEIGDRRYEADALNTLGTVLHSVGQFDSAIGFHLQALAIARETGARQHEVTALVGLAHSYQHRGESIRALECADQARELAGRLGHRLLEGPALTAGAMIRLVQGDLDGAVAAAEAALFVHQETGHRLGLARTYLVLGRALYARGETAAAVARWEQARDGFVALGLPESSHVETLLRAEPPG
ncbi:AfsR/SARP family transcriptional regulator [Flindersiella endophytica]